MAKRRSAKQRANDKRLGRMAKARSRKSAPKRRKASKSRKTNKPRKRTTTVAKRRFTKRRATATLTGGGLINKVPILKNKTVQQIGLGLGMARIASTGANMIPVPQVQRHSRIIGTAVAFSVSPLAGIVDLVLGGGLATIQGLLGGGGGNTNTVSGGFA